jgi:hypothetical protein
MFENEFISSGDVRYIRWGFMPTARNFYPIVEKRQVVDADVVVVAVYESTLWYDFDHVFTRVLSTDKLCVILLQPSSSSAKQDLMRELHSDRYLGVRWVVQSWDGTQQVYQALEMIENHQSHRYGCGML